MSSDEFYGPALPPGFTKVTSDSVLPRSRHDRKRTHSTSSGSSSSSSSSRGSHRKNNDGHKLSEKEESVKSSERLFGPVLPEGFSSPSGIPLKESSFIGPVLPPADTLPAVTPSNDGDDDVGPLPSVNTESKTLSTIQEIEARSQLMKDKLEGKVTRCHVEFCLLVIYYLKFLLHSVMTLCSQNVV